MKKKAITRLD